MTSPTERGSTPGRPAPRSRARVIVPLALAAWLVLEVWLLMLVGEATNALVVVGLLLVGALLGGYVVQRAGARAWRRLTEALRSGQTTVPESSGAALVMLGGALLILPGFASDVPGLLLLVPPVRTLLRRAAPRSLTTPRGPVGNAYQQSRMHHPDGRVVEGEVIDDK